MKIGYCLHGDWFVTKPDLVKILSELGYDGIEIWPQAIEAAGIEAIREMVGGTGLAVASLNSYLNFTESDETFNDSLMEVSRYIEYAKILNSPNVRVYTSKMKAFARGSDATPEQWRRAIAGVKAACTQAAKAGITCLMEVHHGDGQLYDTTPNTLRFMEEVGADNLKVNLQVPLLEEDFYYSAQCLGKHVVHVHANNYKGKWSNFCNLDDGDIDFEKLIGILFKQGFDGYISVEHAMRDPIGVAEYEIKYVRYLIAKLERKCQL